jgi:hypothetical protein
MAEESHAQEFPNTKNADVYANLVNFGTTVWDLRLTFGQMIKLEDREQFEPRVSVTLPWLQAKAMSIYLQMNIFAYEKQYGKIDMPPQFLPSIAASDQEITDPTVKAHIEALQKKLKQILATMADLDPS